MLFALYERESYLGGGFNTLHVDTEEKCNARSSGLIVALSAKLRTLSRTSKWNGCREHKREIKEI